MIVTEKVVDELKLGSKSHGFELIKMYPRFNLWEKKIGSDVIHECCFKDEQPTGEVY